MRAVEAEDPDAVRIGRETLALHRRTTVVGLSELTGLYTIVSAPHGAPVPPDIVASAISHPYLAFRAAVASALCLAGEVDAGVRLLGTPTEVGGDYAGLFAACLTVDVLAAAQHPGLAAAVDRLRPFAGSVATYGSVQSLGSVACFIGSGLVALGRLDEGRAMLERAVVANARVGCPAGSASPGSGLRRSTRPTEPSARDGAQENGKAPVSGGSEGGTTSRSAGSVDPTKDPP